MWQTAVFYTGCGLVLVAAGWWLVWLSGRSAREVRRLREALEDERESR